MHRIAALAHAITRMTERTGDLSADDCSAVYVIACEILDAGRRLETAVA